MVSMIVPVYNGEKYIKACADALKNQSYSDIEIIFINDGSEDSTAALLEKIKDSDNRITVIHKENGGVSAARNAGLAAANGEYIMFCDSDDIPHRDWCGELLRCAEKFPGKLPLCAVTRKDILGNSQDFLFTISEEKRTGEYTELSKKELTDIDDAGMLYSIWNKIFSAKIIKENNILFDETISNGEDALFVFDYLSYVEGKTVFADKNLYTYLQQNVESLSMQEPYAEMLTAEKVFLGAEKLFEKIRFGDTSVEENFYNFHLNRFIDIIGKIISNKKDARKERLKKSVRCTMLPGVKHCITKINVDKTYHKRLINIYKSKVLTFFYHLKLVYF